MKSEKRVLGILGGLGPMASVYFYELLTQHTLAHSDADHIDLLLSSRASTPDRTAYILGESDADPAPLMCADAKRLQAAGAQFLAVPCNTAHFFYEKIASAVTIPVLNIVEETVGMLSRAGIRHIGVLATAGTVHAGAYDTACKKHGMLCTVPDADSQGALNQMIYGQIKCGITPDPNAFLAVADKLSAQGCERLVLGCTELSLLSKTGKLDPTRFADSLEILAYRSILTANAIPVGFPDWFYGRDPE